jgi:hypothetical protein
MLAEYEQDRIDADRDRSFLEESDEDDVCEHVDTFPDEEPGTRRPVWVCEDCGAHGPA